MQSEEKDSSKHITESLDASQPAYQRAQTVFDAERRLALLYELPLKFGAAVELDQLLQLIVEQTVEIIPDARRGALLIRDRKTGQLLRSASVPVENPAVSTTLAERAINQHQGFIWSRDVPVLDTWVNGLPLSAHEHRIQSAIYAPLLWQGEVFGVVCVDNNETSDAFHRDDLRLVQAVAHHAAAAVAHLEIEKALRHDARVLTNFLKLVSPPLAEQLTQYRGPIRLGGEFREATILFSDIRGFTKLSSRMRPEDVAEMLEDYFERLVPIISRHNGMVDKFVGDAIVAVFGSPGADDLQQLNAVRAALEMQTAMRAVSLARQSLGKPTGDLGIGIHWGEVVHGFIGSRERMEYTVIGDAVNRASRYCDGAAGGEILISPEVYQRVWKSVDVRQTSVPTKHEGDLIAYQVNSIKE